MDITTELNMDRTNRQEVSVLIHRREECHSESTIRHGIQNAMGKHGDNTVGPDSDDGHASTATNPTREQTTRQDSKHDGVGESSMTQNDP